MKDSAFASFQTRLGDIDMRIGKSFGRGENSYHV